MTAPFRVFSGFDSRQAEAAEVFAFSVRENASVHVDVQFISADHAESAGLAVFIRDDRQHEIAAGHSRAIERAWSRRGTTAFSYARFLVPYACNYEGIAAFFDGCDQLCLGDVAELAAMDMSGYAIRVVKHRAEGQVRPRIWSSVMLMDCAKLTAWTPEYVETASDNDLMRFKALGHGSIGALPEAWNVLVEPGNDPPPGTKLAHWTSLSNPNGGSWIDRGGSAVWCEWRERWRVAG